MLKVGDKAPEFSAESTHGEVTLSKYRGKNLVIYFYIKDMTPGCTTQSIGIKESIDAIRALNAEVIGVSSDSLEMHKRFLERYNLNFPLVADTDNRISKAYGVYNEERNRARRVTFIVDKEGIVRHIIERVNVETHAQDVINILKQLD